MTRQLLKQILIVCRTTQYGRSIFKKSLQFNAKTFYSSFQFFFNTQLKKAFFFQLTQLLYYHPGVNLLLICTIKHFRHSRNCQPCKICLLIRAILQDSNNETVYAETNFKVKGPAENRHFQKKVYVELLQQ